MLGVAHLPARLPHHGCPRGRARLGTRSRHRRRHAPRGWPPHSVCRLPSQGGVRRLLRFMLASLSLRAGRDVGVARFREKIGRVLLVAVTGPRYTPLWHSWHMRQAQHAAGHGMTRTEPLGLAEAGPRPPVRDEPCFTPWGLGVVGRGCTPWAAAAAAERTCLRGCSPSRAAGACRRRSRARTLPEERPRAAALPTG